MKDLTNYISIKRITLFSVLIVVLFISEGCGESEVFNEVQNILEQAVINGKLKQSLIA